MLHLDARGWLLEGPGNLYASCCWPGEVKAWERHDRAEALWCVWGQARVVVATEHGVWASERAADEGKPPVDRVWRFEERVVGPLSPGVVRVPGGAWHGYAAAGPGPCVVVGVPDAPFDPAAHERAAPADVPFEW